jgi:cytochrome P450
MLRPQFARGQFADLRSEEHHLQYFFLHLRNAAQGVNLRPLFQHLVLDNATEFLCGDSVHALINSLPGDEFNSLKAKYAKQGDMDWTRFAEYFDEATQALGVRVRLFDRYWLYQPLSFHRACRQVHAYADCQVDNALSLQKSRANKQASQNEKFVFLHELVRETQDRIELRSQLLNVLLAGRDTIAGMLSWTFYLLARYPDKYAELRTAVLRDFGSYNEPRDFSFTSLKACQYLQWVLMEVTRLYPAVPVNSRRATRDTSIPRGGGPDGKSPVYIRRGQEVNYYVYAMHRRPDLWGPDAEKFRPERWESRKHGWEYLPFNGGPRICMGQQYALTEGAYVLARMVQRYQAVENADPDPVDRHDYQLTSAPTRVLVRLVEDSDVLQETKKAP